MSHAESTAENRPSRLQLVREKGKGAIPAIPKRGAQLLDIDLLIEDPKNERKTFRNMEGLVDTVRALGVIEPLTVTAHDGGKYMVVTGHRRLRAAREAGLKQLRVVITDPEESQARRRRSIVSNVQREDVPPVELAEALQAILDEDPAVKTQRDLAKMIGKREAWVSDMLRILSLPPALQQELRTSEAPVPYDAVMRISRVDDAKLQKHLVKDVLDGKPNREIRARIDEAKGKKAPTPAPSPRPVAKTTEAPKDQTYRIDLPSATVTVNFKKGPVSKSSVKAMLLQALESLG
ncbi:MAG: ParB/RepB/Spo0J family partition protein [Candidatus Hydrogenedentes bacterium]|nr:ParB/RepB/Spo0J family partition protein [Candidatus Hydrogenedentota bacterium]